MYTFVAIGLQLPWLGGCCNIAQIEVKRQRSHCTTNSRASNPRQPPTNAGSMALSWALNSPPGSRDASQLSYDQYWREAYNGRKYTAIAHNKFQFFRNKMAILRFTGKYRNWESSENPQKKQLFSNFLQPSRQNQNTRYICFEFFVDSIWNKISPACTGISKHGSFK